MAYLLGENTNGQRKRSRLSFSKQNRDPTTAGLRRKRLDEIRMEKMKAVVKSCKKVEDDCEIYL